MAIKSAHWSYTTNSDGTTDHFLLAPEGTRSNVPVVQTDTNGNTALMGPDGPISVGATDGTTITVGTGGDYATLDEALTARAAMSHTLIHTTTGTIAYVANEDNRIVTLASAIANETTGNLGIRFNNAGPIIRCNLVGSSATTTRVRLPYAVDVGYTDTTVHIYQINTVGICILPGEFQTIASSGTRKIPAFTTIYCPVKHGASIVYASASTGIAFTSDGTENEIWIINLNLHSIGGDINSAMFSMGTLHKLANIGFIDNYITNQGQDFLYLSETLVGGVHYINNEIIGTYHAVCSPALFRHLNVVNNTIRMSSRGDYTSEAGDQGNPHAIPIGSRTYSGTYPSIVATIKHNTITCYGVPSGTEGVDAVCVMITHTHPSVSIVDIESNYLEANRHGGTAANAANAACVMVNSTGINTPTIIVRNNTMKAHLTDSADGTAWSMHSTNAAYSIKRSGNRVVSGTLGTNTDDTGFV